MKKNNTYNAWLICSLGALFYCYQYMLRIIPGIMADDLSHLFGIDAIEFGNLAALYYYAYTPMQLPVGLLIDRFGPRKLLTIATLTCALGSYLFTCGILSLAYTGRFLVGIGAAFAYVGTLKLITLWLPLSRFALAVGLVLSLSMLNAMKSEVVLGYLISIVDWKTLADLIAALGVGIACLIWFNVPEAEQSNVIQPIPTVTSFYQLFQELKILIKTPQLWLIGLVGCFAYSPLSVFADLWAIPYLHHAHNLSEATAAEITSMVFLGMGIGSPLIGWISDKINYRRFFLIVGSLSAAFGITTVLYMPLPNLYYFTFLFLLIGLSTGAQSLTFSLVRRATPPELAATSIAFANMLIMLSGVVFQPFIGALLEWSSGTQLSRDLSLYSKQNFQFALVVLPISLFINSFMAIWIKDKKFF